jgi:hypothetical protein
MMVGGVFLAAGAVQASNGHGGEAFWAALLGGISILAGLALVRGGRR